jgi:hypothetical protein
VAVPKRLGSSPSAVGAKRLEHFQEKWPPVFRRKCDQISNLDRLADDAEGARRARTVAALRGAVTAMDDGTRLLEPAQGTIC